MPFWLLLGMQAAGMVFDYFGTQQQQYYSDQGAKLQQQGIEANIYQTRLEAENESLAAMKQLRKNMGTQIAIFAARGQSTAGGTAFSLLSESVSNFNADERTRRINQLGRENELRGGMVISKLNQAATNSKIWQGFSQRTISRFPTSPSAWSQASKNFGLTQQA